MTHINHDNSVQCLAKLVNFTSSTFDKFLKFFESFVHTYMYFLSTNQAIIKTQYRLQ